jgi:hypothetical protein
MSFICFLISPNDIHLICLTFAIIVEKGQFSRDILLTLMNLNISIGCYKNIHERLDVGVREEINKWR